VKLTCIYPIGRYKVYETAVFVQSGRQVYRFDMSMDKDELNKKKFEDLFNQLLNSVTFVSQKSK